MERPLPTQPLIEYLMGKNKWLAEDIFGGLYETPLKGIYPHLNLEEALAFAGISFLERKKNLSEIKRIVDNEDLYGIFNRVIGRGIQILRGSKLHNYEFHEAKYKKMNPYGNKKNLALRLQRVDSETEEKFKENLVLPAKKYVFEIEYEYHKHLGYFERGEAVLLNYYDGRKNKKAISHFSHGISKMIKEYPTYWMPLEDTKKIQNEKEIKYEKEIKNVPSIEIGTQVEMFS